MARYVLVNRRAGRFTLQEKVSSRAAVAHSLALLPGARVVADHQPQDESARRVVLLDAEPAEVARIQRSLSPDVALEPAVHRHLHRRRLPPGLRPLPLTENVASASALNYEVTIRGDGKPLADVEVMFYLSGPGGSLRSTTCRTSDTGKVTLPVPTDHSVAFVEPIPRAGYWIMLVETPASGSTIDCLPLPAADAGGIGWWHKVMGVNAGATNRGAGIKVGVIDSGCGPHPNLAHVVLAGAFVRGQSLPGPEAADIAQHGTHTTGIIGARPTRVGDYTGLAPGCDLFHARVFAGEGPDEGPTQADLIKALDELSRNRHCDLINMSLGGGPPSPAEEDAIRDAAERGTLCICSAGNEGGPIDYPGAYRECAAVAALGRIGAAPVGTFSHSNRPHEKDRFGDDHLFLAAFSCFGTGLACGAPGVGIVSTVPNFGGQSGLYMEMDGTSMASPAVCGAIALILGATPIYQALPRDQSRYRMARKLLAQHCSTIGLEPIFEGRGLPGVS